MYPTRLHSKSELEKAFMEMEGALNWKYHRQFFKAVKKTVQHRLEDNLQAAIIID